jgi:hypothetical protein
VPTLLGPTLLHIHILVVVAVVTKTLLVRIAGTTTTTPVVLPTRTLRTRGTWFLAPPPTTSALAAVALSVARVAVRFASSQR